MIKNSYFVACVIKQRTLTFCIDIIIIPGTDGVNVLREIVKQIVIAYNGNEDNLEKIEPIDIELVSVQIILTSYMQQQKSNIIKSAFEA